MLDAVKVNLGGSLHPGSGEGTQRVLLFVERPLPDAVKRFFALFRGLVADLVKHGQMFLCRERYLFRYIGGRIFLDRRLHSLVNRSHKLLVFARCPGHLFQLVFQRHRLGFGQPLFGILKGFLCFLLVAEGEHEAEFLAPVVKEIERAVRRDSRVGQFLFLGESRAAE